MYICENYKNDDLIKNFVKNFKLYLITGFESVEMNSKRKLRNLFCAGGFYVAKKVGKNFAKSLLKTEQDNRS